MINLRYHIVSITAVFLALGIGLTLGSTFLDRVTVDTLKHQLDTVEEQVRETRADNAALTDRVEGLDDREDRLGGELSDRLLRGRLGQVPVLVIATAETDEALVDATVSSLTAAGAQVSGTWWLTDRWQLEDDREVADLGAVLGLGTSDAGRLRRHGAIRVADLLATASQVGAPEAADPALPAAPPPAASEPTLIAALHERGFLEYQTAPDTPDGPVLLPPAGARYVVISGALPDSGPQTFVTAVLEELVTDAVAAVVAAQGEVDLRDDDGAEASEDDRRTTFVGLLRSGELTREGLSTVDHLDTAAGPAAVVLALEDLAVQRTGHYGVGPGVARLLPPADGGT